MQTSEFSIEREIQFMIKYQLTADELFLMKLILLSQNGHEEYLNEFFTQSKLNCSIRDLLMSLQEKGIIVKSYKVPEQGTIFEPNDVEFNKRVITSFYQHSEDLGTELFNNYPYYTVINGKTFSLRNIAKNFKTFDDFCFEYGKSIKFDPEKHKEILELIEFGKENNLIHSGLCDFIISRQWDTLKHYKEEGLGTFETNELV